jgi:hypothetical protein
MSVAAVDSSEVSVDGIDLLSTSDSEDGEKEDIVLQSSDGQSIFRRSVPGLTRSLGDRDAGILCPCVPEITSTLPTAEPDMALLDPTTKSGMVSP